MFVRTAKGIQHQVIRMNRDGFYGSKTGEYFMPPTRVGNPNAEPIPDTSRWGFGKNINRVELMEGRDDYLIRAFREFPQNAANCPEGTGLFTEFDEVKIESAEADQTEATFEAVSLLRRKVGTKEKPGRSGEGILSALLARLQITEGFTYQENYSKVMSRARENPGVVIENLKEATLEAEYLFDELVRVGIIEKVDGKGHFYIHHTDPVSMKAAHNSGKQNKSNQQPKHTYIAALNRHSDSYDKPKFKELRSVLKSSIDQFGSDLELELSS